MAETSGTPIQITCAGCNNVLDVTGREPFTTLPCPFCGAELMVPLRMGQYLLLSPIGVGAMGTVYRAMDLSLQRLVAIKILKEELSRDAKFVEDFAREARAAAALNHPNIAQLYTFAQHEGQYFIVMELISHGSLDDLINHRKRLTEIQTLDFGIQIASALQAALQSGLIHRDVKPGNVLIGDNGAARLVDFGLARFRGSEHQDQGIWGTPYYFAPEKMQGQVEDFRSDMYSLGGTLFHCLAGRPPFEADTANGVVEKNLKAVALSLKTFAPDISDATALLIARLLRKNPDERYPNYDELIHDLELAKQFAVRQSTARVSRPAPQKTNMAVWLQGIGLGVVAVITITLLIMNWDKIFKPPAKIESPYGKAEPPRPMQLAPIIGMPADWHANFRKGAQKLNAMALGEAAQAYAEAIPDLQNNIADQDWSVVMIGLTHLISGEAEKSAEILQSLVAEAKPKIPETLTYSNMPVTLALALTNRIPLADLETRADSLAPWAKAAVLLARGAQELNRGEVDSAIKTFAQYQKLPRHTTENPWLLGFQGLTAKITEDASFTTASIAKIKELKEANQFEKALDELNKSKSRLSLTPRQIVQPLLDLEPDLKKAVEEIRRQEAARRAEEQRRLEEQRRQQLEAEKKLLADTEKATELLVRTYAFEDALAAFQGLQPQITMPPTTGTLSTHLFVANQLEAFKRYLILDITTNPYDKEDLLNRRNERLTGSIAKADATKITMMRRVGDNIAETDALWRDLPPAQVRKMAEYYLELAKKTGAPPAELSARQMALAVFLKRFNFNKEDFERNARDAVRLHPALKYPAAQYFGRIFDQP